MSVSIFMAKQQDLSQKGVEKYSFLEIAHKVYLFDHTTGEFVFKHLH